LDPGTAGATIFGVTPWPDSAQIAMARDKRKLLEDLRRRKRSCSYQEVEAALEAWGFAPGRTKGHAQVWSYKHVTLTLPQPHGKSGKNDLDPGAVALVIRKIEEADVLQQSERRGEG
jgi:predicted RNA binding protein YcfA (HicA-like mRNA interferase family)